MKTYEQIPLAQRMADIHLERGYHRCHHAIAELYLQLRDEGFNDESRRLFRILSNTLTQWREQLYNDLRMADGNPDCTKLWRMWDGRDSDAEAADQGRAGEAPRGGARTEGGDQAPGA